MSLSSPISQGEEIRQARARRGFSQADLARHLGTTQQTVARWERGQTPQPRWRPQLAEFVDTRPALRLASLPDRADAGLDERQRRALDAYFTRMESGAPLSMSEADLFTTAFAAVGLPSPR